MVDAPAKTDPEPEAAVPRRRERLTAALFRPVDGAGLAYFRIVFGLVLTWEAWRLLDGGWVDRYFLQPEFHFTYWPFDWLAPLPGPAMRSLYLLLALAGLLMAAGLYYRLSVLFLGLGFTYTFLLDKTNYLNHMYLVCLLLLLCLLLPADRVWSLDARQHRPATESVPAWTIWLLRFQIGLPYLFGGIAKLNPDWMFRAEPLRTWLATDTDFPLIGRFFTDEPAVLAMNYGALVLDLGVVFALLNRRTRLFGYIAAVGFHLMNSRLFTLGIFPWLMIAATMIFFPPDWPRRVLEDLRLRRTPHIWLTGAGAVAGALVGAFLPTDMVPMQVAIGALGLGLIGYWGAEQFGRGKREPAPAPSPAQPAATAAGRRQRLVIWLLVAWVAVQVLVPLRHLVIPGVVHWTEEGHRFAWHMLLRSKQGEIQFLAEDPATGWSEIIDPRSILSPIQAGDMRTRPDMILQFSRHLAERIEANTGRVVEIRVETVQSLNSRPPQHLIDPSVDLAQAELPRFLGHAPWLVPLKPLP